MFGTTGPAKKSFLFFGGRNIIDRMVSQVYTSNLTLDDTYEWNSFFLVTLLLKQVFSRTHSFGSCISQAFGESDHVFRK